jgi:single-strand DNA-binding protein
MASKSLNKVVLIGNLTKDPELKYTPSGAPVTSFSLATNRSWTAADGQTKEDVQYHRIVAWQKLAELSAKFLTKGKKVYLEGRITYRKYTTKEGQERDATEIVMEDFILMSSGMGAANDMEKAEPSSAHEEEYSAPKKETMNEKIDTDDIPF